MGMSEPPLFDASGRYAAWSAIPGAPGVQTLSRPLSAEENAARAWAAYMVPMRRMFFPTVGIAGAALVLLVGLVSRFSAAWMVGVAVTWIVVVGLGVAIGMPLGASVSRARAEAELGPGRVLSVAWNDQGFSIPSRRGLRFVAFDDIVRVSREGKDGWFVVVRTRMSASMVEPYVLALPPDLVPGQRLQAWGVAH